MNYQVVLYVWLGKILMAKFEPRTSASKVQLKREFAQSTLIKGNDPNEWISILETLRCKLKGLKSDISEEGMLIHILNNLTMDYSNNVVEMVEEEVGVSLTVDKLREKLRIKHQRTKKSEDGTEETALKATGGRFKGQCSTCGKQGHKGADCWDNPKNKAKHPSFYKVVQDWTPKVDHTPTNSENKSKYTGSCNYCKKPGRRESYCYKKTADD